MKIQKITFLALTALLTVSLAACTSNITPRDDDKKSSSTSQSQSEVSSVDAEYVLQKAESANKEVTSMRLDMECEIISDDSTKDQTFKGELIYDKGYGQLEKGNITVENNEDGQKNYQEMIMSGEEGLPIYLRNSKDGSWMKQTKTNANYYVEPDYFELLKGISKMTNDVKLREIDDEYILTLKSQNVDLMGLFGEEFNLQLTGLTQAEMDKNLEVHFDKKTFYLKDFKLELSYSGQKGNLTLMADASYDDWNEITDDEIKAPQ